MEQEKLDELKAKFAEAYEWRADDSDIDWKEMGYGKALAYLSWAVAWRKMKEIYPDANYRLIETIEGSPLWNVNGYGVLKCAVSACGVEHCETFPIMDNKNNAMKIESIDARDINDSMQRGLTKAIARFGVGLYIFEGKCEKGSKKPTNAPRSDFKPKTTNSPADSQKDPSAPLTEAGITYLSASLAKAGLSKEKFIEDHGFNPYESRGTALRAIDLLKPLIKKENE